MQFNGDFNSEGWQDFKNQIASISIKEWEKRFRDFLSLDFTQLTYQQIGIEFSNRGLFRSFIGLPNAKWKAPVYRVREWTSPHYPDFIDELSHPPSSKSKIGRANKKGYPTFYCCDWKPSALFESKLDKGQIGIMGEWSFMGMGEHRPLIVYPYWNFKVESKLSSLNKVLEDTLNHIVSTYGAECPEHLKLPYKMFHEAFIDESEKMYNLTSWLAHEVIYGDFNNSTTIHLSDIHPIGVFDGISYPSIANNHAGGNFAFHPNFVRHHLKLNKAWMFEVNDNITEKGTTLSLLATCNVIGNHLVWFDPDEPSVADFFHQLGKYN